ncbi:phosphoethanolamine--lipid A transferase [Ramlibacter sp.]|uniref:phosphoethanolamine transferase n=1 Tax=Ramlibacter sp. TaxID=1917967 RepID=UPI002D11DDCB|nr:phosphoethanolamine--lipid A transferase [Ramlibacter sp.]HWI83431.1 phosphoethanolamine--lipid A transferase [Ramlibacter sp.]
MTGTGAAWRRRPVLSVETLVLLGALFIMVAGNGRFWEAALAGRGWADASTWAFMGAVFVALTALYVAAAATLATRYTVKPLLSILLVTSAATAYYMDRYSIYFDRAMLRNVLATNYAEASELLGWRMVVFVLVLGVLPALLVWWPDVKRRPVRRALAIRLAWIVGALGVATASLLLVFSDFASLMRNHKEVRYLINPGNVVSAFASNAWGRSSRPRGPKVAVGADAQLAAAWQGRTRPALFVLVVGETARAQNFALNGYGRPTNPELARRDIVNLPQVDACGTSTEVSLPCMFSAVGRAHYDEEKILGQESLLHVLARAGFQVVWRDNQSGCKGVCSGLTQQQLNGAGAKATCPDGQCLDEVLVQGLDGVARDAKGNVFVVLHQLGSHGPAYFKRYPPQFRRFTPACESEDLRTCSRDEIVNAYDNSLLYTDHVLGQLIDFLDRAQATHDTAMLYVSDHGESLGESGLYLHGVPYAIAPDVQKRVPLVMWLSPAFRRSFGVDQDCLRRRADLPRSHDNLFHSLLGVLDVRTRAYDGGLDLFAGCRANPQPQAAAAGPVAR